MYVVRRVASGRHKGRLSEYSISDCPPSIRGYRLVIVLTAVGPRWPRWVGIAPIINRNHWDERERGGKIRDTGGRDREREREG